MSAEQKQHKVWRQTMHGTWTLFGSYRWRWLAAFIAWERTRRGWFRYEVRS